MSTTPSNTGDGTARSRQAVARIDVAMLALTEVRALEAKAHGPGLLRFDELASINNCLRRLSEAAERLSQPSGSS